MQIVTEPLPPQYLVDTETRVPVGQRQEEVPAKRCQSKNGHTRNPRAEHALSGESLTSRDMPLRPRLLAILDGFGGLLGGICIEDKFKQSTGHERGSEMSREVVMQEQLTAHHVEREVVGCPRQEEETGRVI